MDSKVNGCFGMSVKKKKKRCYREGLPWQMLDSDVSVSLNFHTQFLDVYA